VGGCFFRMRGQDFISIMPRYKWNNWVCHWLYVETAKDSVRLRLPTGPAVPTSAWTKMPALGEEWNPILACIGQLVQDGMTGAMVAMNFFRRRLAPC